MLVEHRRAGRHRALGIDHMGQRVEIDLDHLQRILGQIAVGGQHGRDRLALEAGDPVGHGKIIVLAQTRQGAEHGDRVGAPHHLLAGQHREDTRHGQGGTGVDPKDAGMGERVAQDRDMAHARIVAIIHEAAGAAQQALVFLARHAPADQAVLHHHSASAAALSATVFR